MTQRRQTTLLSAFASSKALATSCRVGEHADDLERKSAATPEKHKPPPSQTTPPKGTAASRRKPPATRKAGTCPPTLFLQRRYAEAMLCGGKVWEGRPAAGRGVSRISEGDAVRFRCDRRPDGLVLRCRVAELRRFRSVEDMIESLGVRELLPDGPEDPTKAAAVYRAFGEAYQSGEYVAWRLADVSKGETLEAR
eukprot:CAMPEP_0117570128 /NCGR_PEP_ID=MMETSP0784-20121206/59031_1 /TAXON_ID=39447 /ORGANISM="" /LENGTH=194 /DNA_ID=CAMNT_0005368157 /DNA_START=92 /DNA_END=676 /DNA_ORIENTATION=+